MKKTRTTRFLSLLLSLVLSFSLCTPALAADSSFSDIDSSYWAWDAVQNCVDLGIVTGFEDGSFRPDDPVTGVQFVAMITRTFYSADVAAAQASKPSGSPWYWANTKVAADKYLTSNMTIEEKAMNRYDMANVAKNVINKIDMGAYKPSGAEKEAVPSQVNDWSSVPVNRTVAIKVCYATGVITGMSDGSFHGEQFMTRAQACLVITRMTGLIGSEPPANPSQPAQPQQPQQPETPEQTGTGLLANGQEATVENVQAILEDIKREYPAGTSWGDRNTTNTNWYEDGPGIGDATRDVRALLNTYNSNASLQTGCGGFMAMVSERIFGKTGAPAREVTDVSKARPGDIIIKFNNNGTMAHLAIVTSYDPTPNGSFTKGFLRACDGNNNDAVSWGTNYDALDVGTTFRIFTRYPD